MSRTKMQKRAERVWLVLLPLEVAAAILSYWTLGRVIPGLLIGATFLLNFVAFAVSAFRVWPGLALAFCYGLLLVGYQAGLGIRWYYVNAEAERIVQWAHFEDKDKGSLPEDLSRYVFNHPAYKNYVRYRKWDGYDGAEKWQVSYVVGTESTYYSYNPDYGWYYHDD